MTVREFITKHEGRRLKPYLDTAKPPKMTIGVGWNMDANPLPKDIRDYLNVHGSITNEMVDKLLDISINQAVKDCHKLFPEFESFSPNRKMALMDFVFQLGLSRSSAFINTIAAINTGRWEDAARGVKKSLYWKQLGGDPPGTDDGKIERPEEIAELIEEG